MNSIFSNVVKITAELPWADCIEKTVIQTMLLLLLLLCRRGGGMGCLFDLFLLIGVYGIFLVFRVLAFWDSHKNSDTSAHLKSGSIGIQLRCGQREESGLQRSQSSVEFNENE